LKSIDYGKLSYEHQTVIMNVVKENYENELNRRANIRKNFNDGLLDFKQWMKLDTKSAHTIANYMNTITNYFKVMSKSDREKMILEEYSNIDGWTM